MGLPAVTFLFPGVTPVVVEPQQHDCICSVRRVWLSLPWGTATTTCCTNIDHNTGCRLRGAVWLKQLFVCLKRYRHQIACLVAFLKPWLVNHSATNLVMLCFFVLMPCRWCKWLWPTCLIKHRIPGTVGGKHQLTPKLHSVTGIVTFSQSSSYLY